MSYVRFQGANRLVSASTDSTLRLWDLEGSGSARAVYDGHINDKNFVGLSTEGDFVACGSETNEVCCLPTLLVLTLNLRHLCSSAVQQCELLIVIVCSLCPGQQCCSFEPVHLRALLSCWPCRSLCTITS